jgi:UV DNA damage endonuclease
MYIAPDGKELLKCKTLQLGRLRKNLYSEERVRETYLSNAKNLLRGLEIIAGDGIRHFRFNSDLIPLADQVPRDWWDNDRLSSIYRSIGDRCRELGMRITFHPGQFCVLNSTRDDVISNAISNLEMHAWIFDSCGFDESPHYAINIHAGAGERFEKLIESIGKLHPRIRKRLTLENCESVASVGELLDVSIRTGVPIVFDSHHHLFRNHGLTLEEASDLSRMTWPEHIKPLQHLSNSEVGFESGSFSERRRHSRLIHHVPHHQLDLIRRGDVDCEIEAKDKNEAVLQMAKDFDISLSR